MRYRQMRLPCDTEVALCFGEDVRRVRFVNISPSGARIEGLGRVPQGAPATLCHLAMRLPVRVAWSNDRQAGLRFVVALEPSDIAALRGVGGVRPGTGWAPAPGFRPREMT